MISIEGFAVLLFWGLLCIPAASFFLYPIFIKIFALIKKPLPAPNDFKDLSAVTMLIAAYNEEKNIREKILNSLSLEYPEGKFKIVVHTDGSQDRTDAIIQEFSDEKIVHIKTGKNKGKTRALNEALDIIDTPVVVYSDANSIYDRQAILNLVRWMQDEKIGCVCGRLVYDDSSGETSQKGESRYWNWDTSMKTGEGGSGFLLGANGAIFALRRELAIRLPGNQSNDMILPITARLTGYKVVYDPSASAREKTAGSLRREFKRKTRIITRGLNGVVYSFRFMMKNEKARKTKFSTKAFVVFQIVCKKLCRYLTFPAAALMMLLIFWLPNGFAFKVSLLMWLGFLLSLAMTAARSSKIKIARRLPDFSYSLMMAWAALLGFLYFLIGKDSSTWKSQR